MSSVALLAWPVEGVGNNTRHPVHGKVDHRNILGSSNSFIEKLVPSPPTCVVETWVIGDYSLVN